MKKTLQNILLTGMITLGTAGLFGNKLAAQETKEEVQTEQTSNFMNDFKPLATFTWDHDKDGYEDAYIITKNPYENLAQIHRINNVKGNISPTATPLNYNIPIDKNSGISAFTWDEDKDGYENAYIITTNNNKAQIHRINNVKGNISPTATPLNYDIPLGFPKK